MHLNDLCDKLVYLSSAGAIGFAGAGDYGLSGLSCPQPLCGCSWFGRGGQANLSSKVWDLAAGAGDIHMAIDISDLLSNFCGSSSDGRMQTPESGWHLQTQHTRMQ